MKGPKGLLSIMILVLVVVAFSLLRPPALSVFLLKGGDAGVEAFHAEFYLYRQDPLLTPFHLTTKQKKEAAAILGRSDEAGLVAFAKDLGASPIVIGFTAEEGWPSFLGGGLKALRKGEAFGTFDNLTWADRLYLSFHGRVPPPAPFVASEAPTGDLSTLLPPSKEATPPVAGAPLKTGTLRVEILNGCGIKGAADWVARRVKGPGILIVGTDNADNFRYAQTVVKTSAGMPVALEEALGRLGLSKSSVEEAVSLSSTASEKSGPSSPVDIIVIVGRDFQKLKGLARERNRH